MKSILSLVTLLILSACNDKGQGSKPSLIGKWKPVEVTFTKMTEEKKKEVLSSSTLEFTKDSNYISIYKNGRQEGVFTFNPDDNKFRTFANDGSDDSAILSWEKGLLKLTHKDGYIVLKKQ